MNWIHAKEVRDTSGNLSPGQKLRFHVLHKIVFIGRELWDGFSEPMPIYLFWCENCGRPTKDYPHGFIEKRYLQCGHCRTRRDFTPWWLPWAQLWTVLSFLVRHKKSSLKGLR